MSKSAVERLRNKETIEIKANSLDLHGLTVDETSVFLNGCDCSAQVDYESVRRMVEALSAWVRINKP